MNTVKLKLDRGRQGGVENRRKLSSSFFKVQSKLRGKNGAVRLSNAYSFLRTPLASFSSTAQLMFNRWGNKEQQAQSSPQEANNASLYSPSVVSSPSSSRPATPNSNSSSGFYAQSPTNRPNSVSHVSPAEAADIIAALRNKSVDELKKLVYEKDAYHNFLLSLEAVKTQNNVRDELRNATLQLARENLEKEPWIMELRNQCRIIRTSELAAAQEKMHELERRKEELLKSYSPVSLLHQLQDAMKKTEEESEAFLGQLLDREIDLTTFVQKYKKLQCSYHKRALTHLAAKASLVNHC